MNMFKRMCALICALAVFSLFEICSFATSNAQIDYVALAVDVPWALVNGKEMSVDENDNIKPYVKNNRTMLPVRFVAESLGADVSWENGTVVIKKDASEIKMKPDSNVLSINGKEIALDASGEIVQNRTMVPVRAIADGFGLNVSWHNGAVLIYGGEESEIVEQTIFEDVKKVCEKYAIMPRLVNLSVGGQMIKGFDSYQNVYTLRTEDGKTDKLHISAVADAFSKYEVTKGDSEIKITVRPKFGFDMENVYTIRTLPKPDFAVYASSFQSPNYPDNSVDEDFSSRWAAEGEQWIQYNFNDAREIERVKIAFWRASETRKAKFDILAGEDIKNMTKVFSGESTLATEEFESFEFEKIKAKYVRIVCHGNTENNWNSILEVKFE